MSDVEERGRAERDDRRANVWIADDVYPEELQRSVHSQLITDIGDRAPETLAALETHR